MEPQNPQTDWRFVWVGITEAGWKIAGAPQHCPWHRKRLEWADGGLSVSCPACIESTATIEHIKKRPDRYTYIEAQKEVEKALAAARGQRDSMRSTVYSLQEDLEAHNRRVDRLEAAMAWFEDTIREAP